MSSHSPNRRVKGQHRILSVPRHLAITAVLYFTNQKQASYHLLLPVSLVTPALQNVSGDLMSSCESCSSSCVEAQLTGRRPHTGSWCTSGSGSKRRTKTLLPTARLGLDRTTTITTSTKNTIACGGQPGPPPEVRVVKVSEGQSLHFAGNKR